MHASGYPLTARFRKWTSRGKLLSSSMKASVGLAEPRANTENSLKNFLMARRARVGGKLRRWKIKKRDQSSRLLTIYPLRPGRE
jgi:hypothetical protein